MSKDIVELECPLCYALVDVSGLEKYEQITCPNCGSELEYDGESSLVEV